MTDEYFVKKNIYDNMFKLFFIEGEDNDYYFGKSVLNNNLTLFINDIGGGRINSLRQAAEECAQEAILKLFEEKGIARHECSRVCFLNLKATAFYIDGRIIRYDAIEYDYSFAINVMKTCELEAAIEREPQRWNFYIQHRDD